MCIKLPHTHLALLLLLKSLVPGVFWVFLGTFAFCVFRFEDTAPLKKRMIFEEFVYLAMVGISKQQKTRNQHVTEIALETSTARTVGKRVCVCVLVRVSWWASAYYRKLV